MLDKVKDVKASKRSVSEKSTHDDNNFVDFKFKKKGIELKKMG
jgi:hypothetical protein